MPLSSEAAGRGAPHCSSLSGVCCAHTATAVLSLMSTTMTTTATESPKQVRYRNLTAAREAYSCDDEPLRRELSRDAHNQLLNGREATAGMSEPGSPQMLPTWSPWTIANEAGHTDELANRGATLVLRGAQHGLISTLTCLSLGDAAGWAGGETARLSVALLVCCAAYSACVEALENVTYAAYFDRERKREAWELDNFPEGEVEEMVQLYTKRGLAEHQARTVVNAMASNPHFFVDVMMLVRPPHAHPSAITLVHPPPHTPLSAPPRVLLPRVVLPPPHVSPSSLTHAPPLPPLSQEELQMSPPALISPHASALRIGGSMLASGAMLQLVGWMLEAGMRAPSPSGRRPPSFWPASNAVYLPLLLGCLGLLYLGSLRASITHQMRRKLAMQTCAVAVPCVVLARWAGGVLLADLR